MALILKPFEGGYQSAFTRNREISFFQRMMKTTILPKDVIDTIQTYVFHSPGKIPKTYSIYETLRSIPMKEYDPSDGVTYVYMSINNEKDYFMTYNRFQIQLQTLMYIGADRVHTIEGHTYKITDL